MTGRVQFNIHSKIMTSINQGTQNIPKWMVYNGKSYENLMIWGYPHEKISNTNETMVDVGNFHIS
jgi:cytoplasmic iron level regulating protein YaaA (DUF328/UPF0246 family)